MTMYSGREDNVRACCVLVFEYIVRTLNIIKTKKKGKILRGLRLHRKQIGCKTEADVGKVRERRCEGPCGASTMLRWYKCTRKQIIGYITLSRIMGLVVEDKSMRVAL